MLKEEVVEDIKLKLSRRQKKKKKVDTKLSRNDGLRKRDRSKHKTIEKRKIYKT